MVQLAFPYYNLRASYNYRFEDLVNDVNQNPLIPSCSPSNLESPVEPNHKEVTTTKPILTPKQQLSWLILAISFVIVYRMVVIR